MTNIDSRNHKQTESSAGPTRRKRALLSRLTTRVSVALILLGVAAIVLSAKAYSSEVVGAICGSGRISESVGSGTCSWHDGVDTKIEVDTFVGLKPVSWVDRTRWPLGIAGLLSLMVGASALTMQWRGRSDDIDVPGSFWELHVRVGANGNARTVTATAPDRTQASAPFVFDGLSDRGAERLHELLNARRKPRFGSNQAHAVEALGNDLFEAIFPPGLEAIYRRSSDTARQRNLGLRIVLELDDTTADLPWEYLHDKERSSFLALSTEASVVRRLPVTDETRLQSRIETLRILVMGSAPTGSPSIDVGGEQERIRAALGPSTNAARVAVEFVEGGTFEDLRAHLDSFQPHVLHFVGHGRWDNDVDDGELLFESKGGGPRAVTGRELGVLLVRPELRLVLLNSCQAARSSQEDRFAGIATSLVAQGVPAVLAMQFPIEDQAASRFGSTFIRHLVESGSIDVALNKARQAVFTTQRRVEWGTPVLTTRVPVDQVLPASGDNPAL